MSDIGPLLGNNLEVFRAETQSETVAGKREPAKRLKPIERGQVLLRAIDVEKLIELDHPARGILAMVNRLNLTGLEAKIKAVEGRAGQSSLNPRLLMALWIYGYSEGISSARELSRMCDYEPGCQWLTAMQPINYHTLADFRVQHKQELEEIFVQVLGLLSAEGLVEMKRVTQDGTKIRAHVGSNSFYREQRIREHLKAAREQVEALQSPESGPANQRMIQARKRAREEKKQRLENALRELEQIQKTKPESKKEQTRISETDPDARVMKQADGGFAPSYNVQTVTDAAQGIILATDVVQAGNDCDQLIHGMNRVEAMLGQTPAQVLVDGGYTMKNANIEAMAERGIDLIGPVPENNSEASLKKRGLTPDFYPDKFRYDASADCFTYPAEKSLQPSQIDSRQGRTEYIYQASPQDCATCGFRDQCCPKKAGRMLVRREDSPAVAAFRTKMQTAEAKQIYRNRAQVAEFPHAWIKDKMAFRRFRLRGLAKVRAEAIWVCLTYNIQQWLRLSWRQSVLAMA